jgi:hypothetical protein
VTGTPIRVAMNGKAPRRFDWQNRTHPVDTVLNQWRVDIEWWRVRVWRDYYKLITETGLMVLIFHDRTSNQWYLQRLYD